MTSEDIERLAELKEMLSNVSEIHFDNGGKAYRGMIGYNIEVDDEPVDTDTTYSSVLGAYLAICRHLDSNLDV